MARSSRSSIALPVDSPVTASQTVPVSRSRMDVRSRNRRTSLGLPVEDLFDEVVDDEPVVAGEPGDERLRVVTAPERQCGQLQGGDPTLGALLECGDVVGGQAADQRSR